jgi:ATP-dependent Clp protease ATP-binding subunit ClpC
VLALAQSEARAMHHATLETEHILLGLLCEGHGLASRLLESMGITLDEARATILRVAGQGETEPEGHIPFAAQVKELLERARNEALSLDHESVGTEHLLLGLLRQGDGVAAHILREQRS